MVLTKETEEKINQIQMIEQNLQQFLMQKQQHQTELVEIESSLKELESASEAYKIVGSVMVKSDPATLKKDLAEKKEKSESLLKTIDTQEQTLREKAQSLQQEVMEMMKGDDNAEN